MQNSLLHFLNGLYIGNVTSYDITGLTAGATHTYTIQAVNASGNSANSNTVSLTLIPAAPVANPSTNNTSVGFTANWSPVTGATSYNLIVYVISGSKPVTKLNTTLPSNTTSYDVPLIGNGYYYKVTAINDSGTSAVSNVVTALYISNLVAYYPFNSNTNDISGNVYNGTPTGSPTLATDRFGVANKAYSFDGIDDFVEIPTAVTSGLTQFSIQLWIKGNETGTNATFWRNPTIFGVESSSAGSCDLGITTNSGNLGYWHGLVSGVDKNFTSTNNISDNTWHSVTLTNDGTTALLYLDNALISASSTPTGQALLNTSFYIGAGHVTQSAIILYHRGIIDDVRVYNKALSTPEINALYHEGGY